MTLADARTLAQADPVPNLTANWGHLAAKARRQVDDLASTLRELDKVQQTLGERGLTVATDLGPIGNAAMAAWRTTQEHKERHDHDFVMPKAV